MWGSPVALALTLAMRLTLGNAAPFAAIFWLSLAAAVIAATALAGRRRGAAEPVASQA